jgi:alkaline phosphatase D
LKERNQLFDEFHKISLAKHQANNLIVLTGDIHCSIAFKLEHGNEPLGVEWVAPSVTSANYNERYSSCKTKAVERKLRNKELNTTLDFVNLRHHGYVLIELTTSHAKSTWFKVKVNKPGKTKSKKIHSESIHKIITLNG